MFVFVCWLDVNVLKSEYRLAGVVQLLSIVKIDEFIVESLVSSLRKHLTIIDCRLPFNCVFYFPFLLNKLMLLSQSELRRITL